MIRNWRFGFSLGCPKVCGAFHNKEFQNTKGFIVCRLHGCAFLSPSIFDSNWTLQIADDIVVVSRRSCCRRIMPRIEIIPPVVHREFLVRSRAPITYWLRLGAAGTAFIMIGIAVSFSLFSGMAGGLANGAGWFAFFSWCLWSFCLVEGVRQSFDMLSGEKREGTIGLLFLTQMRGLDVVLGKVSAGFIASFFPVLGALPILGILILLGGVSGAEFARMSAALLATLGASLAVGIFVSARSVYAGKALSAACGILLIWILVSIIGSAVGWPMAIPSPWTLFRNSFDSRYLADPSGFWVSLGIVLGTASLFLIGAGRTIGRKWRETTLSPAGRQSAVASSAARTRREEDRKLLEKHPIAWLASPVWRRREIRAAKLLALLAALVAFVAPSSFSDWVLIFLFVGIFCAILWQGIGLFWKARSSSWLELLLTTPISEREIGEQLNSQVRRWAMKGALLLLALNLAAFFGMGFQYLVGWGIDFSSSDSMMLDSFLEEFPEFGLVFWLISKAGILLLDYVDTFCWLYGACWYALWRGLVGKSLGNALGRTLLVTFVVYLVVGGISLYLLLMLSMLVVTTMFSPLASDWIIINLVFQAWPDLLAIVFFSWLGWKAKRRLPLELIAIRTGDQKKNR